MSLGDREPYGSVGEIACLGGAGEAPPGNPGLGLIATSSRTPRHRARSRASPLIVTDVGTWQTPAASEGGPAPMDPRCNAVRVSQRGPGPAVLSAERGRH